MRSVTAFVASILLGAGAACPDEPPGDLAPGPSPGSPTLTLGEAVAIALERNFSLLRAADEVRAASLNEASARAEFYPKLAAGYRGPAETAAFEIDASQRVPWSGATLSTGATFQRLGDDPPRARAFDLTLLLAQPLLRGFGPTVTRFDLDNRAREHVARARAYALSRQRLAVEVASAFYQVLRQRELGEVARSSLERNRRLRDASEARLKVGLSSRLDVLRAELQAAQAEEAMVSADATLATTLERFRLLLGKSPDDPVEPAAAAIESSPDPLEPLPVLVDRAGERRLDLHELRDRIDDARRSLARARQSLLPQIDAGLRLTRTGIASSFSTAFAESESRIDFFLAGSYPFERTAERSARSLAQLDLREAERDLVERERTVAAEVSAAAREVERVGRSLKLQRTAVEVASRQHRLALLRYQRGLSSNFDVIDAEGSLVAAKSAVASLLADLQVARLQLRRATGELDPDRDLAR